MLFGRKMVKNASEVLADADASDTVLVVGIASQVSEESPEEGYSDYISILSSNDGTGTQSTAYLVYGIPGTGDYSFFDLNNLPADYEVEVRISSAGKVQSNNLWRGNLGNSPQPLA